MRFHGHLFSAALALATIAGSAGAASQMYKCVEGGRTIYQQQACAVTPQEAPASAAKPAAYASASASASAAAAPASAGARKVKPSLPPASSVPATPR
jgi:hypothetical protein